MAGKAGRTRGIIAASVGAGLSVAAYVATLPAPQQAQVCADLAAIAAEDPAAVPIVAHSMGCGVTPTAYKIGEYVSPKGVVHDVVCRQVEGTWRHYGPGSGGTEPCPVDPVAVGQAYPSEGPSRHYGRQIRAMIERDDKDEIRAFVDAALARKAWVEDNPPPVIEP